MSEKAKKNGNNKVMQKMLCPESGKGLALRIFLGLVAPYAYLMLCGLVFDRWLRLYGMTTFVFFSYGILQGLGIAVAIMSIRNYLRKKKGKKPDVSVTACIVSGLIGLAIVAIVFAILLSVVNKDAETQTRDVTQPFAGAVVENPPVANEEPEENVEEVTENTEEETGEEETEEETEEEVTEETEEETEEPAEGEEETAEAEG